MVVGMVLVGRRWGRCWQVMALLAGMCGVGGMGGVGDSGLLWLNVEEHYKQLNHHMGSRTHTLTTPPLSGSDFKM
ncbi:Protein of unknown function [Gryllus bimaculatus]|nr:Protein of unknown function [Gryllus bimaculatus]